MKQKTRLIILIIGLLIIASLMASAIQDILNITIKDKISPTGFNIIHYALVLILVAIMFNLPPFKELNKKLDNFLKKRGIIKNA